MGSKNRTGCVYGYLTVIEQVPDINKKISFWLCKCKCGKEITVKGGHLNSGSTKSCGCLSLENLIKRNTIHSKSNTPEHVVWQSMIGRCTNINNHAYKDYGGRGIKVCDRWLNSFVNFQLDMGDRPSENHTLDRYPNNDGDYEPNNCRWATMIQQAENRRSNKWYEFYGLRMLQKDWATYFNVDRRLFNKHIKNKGIEGAFGYFNKNNNTAWYLSGRQGEPGTSFLKQQAPMGMLAGIDWIGASQIGQRIIFGRPYIYGI